MFDDKTTRALNARREANEVARALQIGGLLFAIAAFAILGVMIHFNFSLDWIVAAGFAMVIVSISALIAEVFRRLDAGRSYIEQTLTEIEERSSS
ncbi:MAG TPA: hypothetical protein VG271_05505 [Beijerinckiaceae bacterium]|nr:hypothetical protein [Beijerinckiaceae bacterium]